MPTPTFILNNQDGIRNIEVLKQTIDFNIDGWDNFFPENDLWHDLRDTYEGHISRGDIFEISRNSNPQISQQLFLAVMLWGYGGGYGPWRTTQMFDDESFNAKLFLYCTYINENNIMEAYDSPSINWCGPAFFTKFFYFYGFERCQILKPLILDSVVANSIETHLNLPINNFAHVDRNDNNIIVSINCYSQGYMNYIQCMHEWAQDINARPDQIELFLFNTGQN